MARSPSSPIILPCPAKRVSAFSVVDGSVYRPPRIRCAPSPDRGIDNSALSAQMDLTRFVYTLCDCKLLTARRAKPRIRPPLRSGELPLGFVARVCASFS